jgi:prepilin-type processing-associated H-X9-DG protein
VLHPSGTALFGDGQYSAGADKFMRAPWPNPGDDGFAGRWAGTQGFRHQQLSNAAFCDGHAESLRNCYTNNADGAINVASGTGFLSAGNSMYDPQ